MTEPAEGPYVVDSEDLDMIVITTDETDIAEVFDNCDLDEQLATARLLAASWEMRKEFLANTSMLTMLLEICDTTEYRAKCVRDQIALNVAILEKIEKG